MDINFIVSRSELEQKYFNVVTHSISVLLQIKAEQSWICGLFSTSSCTGVYRLLKTIRLFGHPIVIN